MTKNDFEELANVLKRGKPAMAMFSTKVEFEAALSQWKLMANDISAFCCRQSPKFNATTFSYDSGM